MSDTPSRPKPSMASDETLVRHYNSRVEAYNRASELAYAGKKRSSGFVPMQRLEPEEHARLGLDQWNLTRKDLIALIRRQNHRLKHHIKPRALELLYEKVRETATQTEGLERTDDRPLVLKDGKYTVGHTYQHILSVLREEFPEASTSVACLRWYVVYERTSATEQGLPWPDLPHFRPRSSEGRQS